MKVFLIPILFGLSLNGHTQGFGYSTNDGVNAPGTLSIDKKEAQIIKQSADTDAGRINRGGVSPDKINTSPNPAPMNDQEFIESTTLSSEGDFDPLKPGEIEAQEESPLDYSTTPEKRPEDK